MSHFADAIIKLALREDIGTGDITTNCLIDAHAAGRGVMVVKEPLVVAGIDTALRVFQLLDPDVEWVVDIQDGGQAAPGDTIARVHGKMQALLSAERTALNFLQRLSGIATHVRDYLGSLESAAVRLVDTRKTTPGLRVLEKYAVRVGGAHNHRMGLFDGVLIKDNHIIAAGGITPAVAAIRGQLHHLIKIEVEVNSLSDVREALAAGADVIMLDNMNLEEIKQALALIGESALVEVSGGVTRNTLNALAKIGVAIISVGALTHAARSVDISMRIQSRAPGI